MVEIIKNRHIFVLVALVFVVHKAHGKESYIKCYSCNSVDDAKCGGQWGYKSDPPVVKCMGKNAACKKVVSRDAPKATEYVLRECWNTTDSETLPDNFHSCTNMMKVGDMCYCNTDFCNGQGHLLASGLVITIATLAALFGVRV